MIRRKEQLPHEIREHFYSGKGTLDCLPLLAIDEFQGKGRAFSINILKPGHSIGEHAHMGEFEVYYILKGEGTYHDNGVDVKVKVGDATYAWDGDRHGITNDGVEDLEMITLILFSNK
jgi:mannose-6-phosphate isomerase-like protein (cupin superfamily)